MPANTAAVTSLATSLATSFEGMGGATALSLIAFSVVFLVLGGLTLLIYAMRLVTKVAGNKAAVAPAKPKAAPAAAPAAPDVSAASAGDELVAVITAAIAAELGSMVAVKSIVPVSGGHMISDHTDGWLACARMEGLQGALADGWR